MKVEADLVNKMLICGARLIYNLKPKMLITYLTTHDSYTHDCYLQFLIDYMGAESQL